MEIDMGQKFHTEVINGNIVHVKISDATDEDGVGTLKTLLEKSHDLTVEIYNNTGDRIRGLIDLSDFTHYSPKVVSIIAEVLKKNRPYVEKTATYGGTPFIRLAQETVYALAGRDNFGAFDTKEEALEWLKEGHTEK
jgi:hypothetical protein